MLRLQEERFRGGDTVSGLVVYERPGGLTPADRRRIVRDARRAARALPLAAPPAVPFAPGAPSSLVSPDGSVAYAVVQLPDDNRRLAEWGKTLREIAGSPGGGGLKVAVTGPLGFNADFEEIFSSIDVKVLLVTVTLVLVLLGLIYRSPVIALIPLVVVGFAYGIAQGLVYLYARSGATVSDNGTSILIVLMFGVGTDYCLLLVARYREELRSHADKHDAMEAALGRSGPAILASGLTVALTMLVLLLAQVGSTHSLGPVSAIGVAVALTAGLTLLPALLTICGRRGFWPRRHLVELAEDGGEAERVGVWRRVGERVLHRPGAALAVTVALFGAGALGLLAYQEDYSVEGVLQEADRERDRLRAPPPRVPGRRALPHHRARHPRGRPGAPGRRRGRAASPGRRARRGGGRARRALHRRADRPARRGLPGRPVPRRGARARRRAARERRARAARRARAGGRRQRGAGRLRPHRGPRPADDRPAGAARHLRDPRGAAARAAGAAAADRVGRAVVPRHARLLDPVLPLRARRRGDRRVPAHLRVHLPHRARRSTTRSSS